MNRILERSKSFARRYGVWAVALAGLGAFVFVWQRLDRTRTCGSDFSSFYTGGKLAFSRNLYSLAEQSRVQQEAHGCGVDFSHFVRPPHFAVLYHPISRLSFRSAVDVWLLLCVSAVLVFVCLWPGGRPLAACMCTYSLPLIIAFTYGQDVPLLLLALGASIFLLSRGREFAAGVVLSAGLAKPHVFAIAFLVILTRRRWRIVAGLALGVGLAAFFCLTLFGLAWIPGYLKLAVATNPRPETMVNLHGLACRFAVPLWGEAVAGLGLLWVVRKPLLRSPMPFAVAFGLATGIAVGFHSYYYDLALAIPAYLLVLESGAPPWVKAVVGVLASPAVVWLPQPVVHVVQLSLPASLVLISLFRNHPSDSTAVSKLAPASVT